MDDAQPDTPVSPPAPEASAETAPAVTYEFDFAAPEANAPAPSEAPEAPAPLASSRPLPAEGAGASPPDPVADLRTQNTRLERELNEIRSQFAPLVEERQRVLLEATKKPPVSLERLQSGEATAQELMAYIDWQAKQGLAEITQRLAVETRVAHSEAQARGQFSPETMGAPDRSYDQLRATYLEPAYARDPSLRSHVFALVPENPALAEMYAATILRARELHKGNDVAALKAVMDAVGARVQGAEETTQRIQEAARRGADTLVRERGPGAQRRRLDSQAIWDMSDAEFERLQRQQGVA